MVLPVASTDDAARCLPVDSAGPGNTECWYCDMDDVLAGTEELRAPEDCQLGVVERPVTALVVIDEGFVTLTGCDDEELLF